MVSLIEVFGVALIMAGQGAKCYISEESGVQFLSNLYQKNGEFFVMSRIITYYLKIQIRIHIYSKYIFVF